MTEISARNRQSAKGASPLAVRVLELVASGQASSRAELAALLGAAPSTISVAVGQLVERGLIAEEGTQSSTGGRPRKVLRLGGTDEFAVAADLGGRHARIGVVLPGGRLGEVSTVPFVIADGPEEALPRLAEALEALAEERGRHRLRAVGLSLPGPVDIESGAVVLPSRMPGWNRFPVAAWLEDRFGVPSAVDNDANCMAMGEHTVRPAEHRQSIMVKMGSAIGAGVIVDGRLYRGATGAAGDITHIRIDGAADIPCSCGKTGCLETVASGAALVRILRERGADVGSIEDVVRLAVDADPEATGAVRRAGEHLGQVLAANVNFFNPDAVYLGGILSTLEPFVAAVRSQLYESCHPLVTEHLTIERARLGADAGVVGAGQFALQQGMAHAVRDFGGTGSGAARPGRPPRTR
ncbi:MULTISPECIES: ROK family protein [Streptomyces]|uniref:Sugar kinase of the NBD/HSP70 family, may contain an N-terminal HTH domain n=1 Tax=Streptomyces misionensis TaxID=67331 RepID=A0A1H5EQV2_9ACTN|nr:MULTISPECIES: ROK family protein [Streptomyces]QLJ03942.1 ROK family protein [Streptomyces sp. NEAU-sy36]SED93334.1 Sugar kinase of the NBD/HSP70 family, may contain an N-terminal HTH domain [Streptomyces misionensis]SFY52883.1 N-acetylglucosamine repressor [Streptomyces sp. F-1]